MYEHFCHICILRNSNLDKIIICCMPTVLYNSSSLGMVRKWWILTPFSKSSFTKSTRSSTRASIIACSREFTYERFRTWKICNYSLLPPIQHSFFSASPKVKVSVLSYSLTQRINSNFLGSVSSGGSGFAFPFPFPFFARVLLRGALAGLFCFSWVWAAEVAVLAMAPAGWPYVKTVEGSCNFSLN